MKWKDLTLVGEDFNYKMSSTTNSNYSELRTVLMKGMTRNKDFEIGRNIKNRKSLRIWILIFVVILGSCFFLK